MRVINAQGLAVLAVSVHSIYLLRSKRRQDEIAMSQAERSAQSNSRSHFGPFRRFTRICQHCDQIQLIVKWGEDQGSCTLGIQMVRVTIQE